MTADEIVPRLRRLLVENLRIDRGAAESIGADEPLFGSRLGLDSVDALELVVALEREFDVSIPSEEIGGRVFTSLRTLGDWLAARAGGAAPAPPAREA
jgi:acyl carrier protein